MKRLLYILGVFLTALLLVLGMLVCVLMSDKVETAVVQLATEELSRGLGTQATIGTVSYHFPARLRVKDVYIEDQQGDTLLYVEELYAQMKLLPLRNREICFSKADLIGAKAYIHRIDEERYNYDFLVDAFRTDKPKKGFHAFLSVRDVRIERVAAEINDLQARLDYAYMDLHHLTADSLDAEIRGLSGVARRGKDSLKIEDLQAHFVYNDTLMCMPKLYVRLPQSELDASGVRYTLHPGDNEAKTRLLAKQNRLSLHIAKADILPKDLALVAPAIGRMDKHVRITGDVSGTVDSIQAWNLALYYHKDRLFLGNASAVGLPDLSNPYLRLQCEDLYVNARLLQDFLSDLTDKPYRLPAMVHRLGNVHYRGQIDGQLHDIVLHGAFRTGLGTITTDGQLVSDSVFQKLRYDMRVVTRRFQLGRLLGQQKIGAINVDVSLNGKLVDKQPSGKVCAHIRNLSFNDYTYNEIHADGTYRHKHYNGTLSIEDENLQLYFDGLVNLAEERPEIACNLRLDKFRLGILGLSDKVAEMETGGVLAVDLRGVNPDRMSGYMRIDTAYLYNGADSVRMRQLEVQVRADGEKHKQIHLTSDFLTMGVSGDFRYKDVPNALLRQGSQYLPHAFSAEKRKKIETIPMTDTRMDFYVYGHKLRALQKVLRLSTKLSDHPVAKGFFNETEDKLGLMVSAPGVRIGKQPIRDITLSMDNVGGQINVLLSAEALNMGGKLFATAGGDSIYTLLALQQTDSAEHKYGGEIELCTHFLQYAGKPLIDMHILPSVFQLKDSVYTLSDSRIAYCVADTTLGVHNFDMHASNQYIRADGMASSHIEDSLHIELGNIDAGYVLPFVLPEKNFKLGGNLTGWATLYGLFSTPVFEADVRLDSARMNDMYTGTAIATVGLDKQTKNVLIDGRVVMDDKQIASVDGTVRAKQHQWEINVHSDSVPLNFIDHWTDGILENICGYAVGEVRIFGDKDGGEKHVYVTTQAKAKNAALTIPYTGCRYHFDGDAYMDSTSIQFRELDLFDEEGHKIHFNGGLHHTCFKDWSYHFDVTMSHALVYDIPDKAGEMLQGKVYADGGVTIDGTQEELKIDVNAKTVGKSRFRFGIDYASSAVDNNFITFVDHNAVIQTRPKEEEMDIVNAEPEEEKLKLRFQMNMNIEANPHLLFQLVLGSQNGDMLQGRGDGNIRFAYDSQTGDVKLLGTYSIQQGTFDFTVANMIHRQFTLSEGGTIMWSGDPANPQINATAKYRVTASLKDLFGSDISQLATTRTSVPVNTCLTMTGNLQQPILQFGIELPLSDEAIQSQVRSIINTDEMLMRQVIYLLVFGRFFTPEYMTNTQYAGLNETYSFLSSTITGQINSWLSKLTNVFTMGVNIRTDGEGKDAAQEYEAQFQLQPVDRLLINGNVGYRYNDIAKQPFFGDLDVEVLLTDDGKLRLKGYTHTVDKYSLRQANTIQGIGLVWKYDFNVPTKEERALQKEQRAQRKAEKQAAKEAKKQKQDSIPQDTLQTH